MLASCALFDIAREAENLLLVVADEVALQVDPASLQGVIVTDGALDSDELTLDTARVLEDAGPWGQGFPEPLFDGAFQLVDARPIGEAHLRMELLPERGRAPVEGIAFNLPMGNRPEKGDTISLAYRVTVNRYREERLQLVVEHLAPAARPE